jgi:hypothetical protein
VCSQLELLLILPLWLRFFPQQGKEKLGPKEGAAEVERKRPWGNSPRCGDSYALAVTC